MIQKSLYKILIITTLSLIISSCTPNVEVNNIIVEEPSTISISSIQLIDNKYSDIIFGLYRTTGGFQAVVTSPDINNKTIANLNLTLRYIRTDSSKHLSCQLDIINMKERYDPRSDLFINHHRGTGFVDFPEGVLYSDVNIYGTIRTFHIYHLNENENLNLRISGCGKNEYLVIKYVNYDN